MDKLAKHNSMGYDIIIADDHRLFRKGIVTLLNNLKISDNIREASNGKELIELIRQREPQLVILDLEMPEMDGVEAAKRIIKNHPEIKILVVTMYDNSEFVNYLWELGVHGYLLKNSELNEMKKAITSVIEKDFYMNKTLITSKQKISESSENYISEKFRETYLSAKEKEVLKLICEEYSNNEIARHMNISRRTVEKCRSKIMEKLHVKKLAGLVKYAIKNKIIKV